MSLALALSTAAPSVRAQVVDSAARIDQLQPASPDSPFPRAEGPRSTSTDEPSVAARVIGEYLFQPLRASVVGGSGTAEPVSLVEHAALVHVGGLYSPRRWLHLEFNVPFAVYERGSAVDLVKGEPLPAGTMGVGDLRVGAHTAPIRSRAFGLQLGARFWAPTGTPAAYLQGPKRLFRVEAVVAAAGETDGFLYGCTLGLAPLWFAGRDGDRLAATCAAGVKLGSATVLALEPHVSAFTFRSDPEQPTLAGLGDGRIAFAFEPMGSLAFRAGDFRIGLAGGAGLGDAPGTAAARGMLSLTYAPSGGPSDSGAGGPDQDLDGVADGYDACPNEAGPRERRGCPERRDEDGDGILADDACPTQAGGRYDDPKANGCPDRDNDHVADPLDACATEPGEVTNGCPRFARLQGKAFRISPPIAFAQGTERLNSTGIAALVEVARTIRANPSLGHVAVKLGARGSAARLTDARAAAVLAVLNEQNLESNRYELVLDESRPNGTLDIVITR